MSQCPNIIFSHLPHCRRAFAAATVHDMFNWLTVITLLPIEVASGYLEHLTSAIVASTNLASGGDHPQFLSMLTEPFTNLIVQVEIRVCSMKHFVCRMHGIIINNKLQVDKDVLAKIAEGDPAADEMSLLKYWCEYEVVPVTQSPGES